MVDAALTAPKAKKKRKARTPLEKAAEQHVVEEPIPQRIAPEDLHCETLVYQRERAYAICMSYRFERWLLLYVSACGIPLDNCMKAVTLLTCYVEAGLLARVRWPDEYTRAEPEDEPEEVYALPRTEADAAAYGLSISKPRPGKHRMATLPGCHGDAGTCGNLREYGHLYCPKCEAAERRKWEAAATM